MRLFISYARVDKPYCVQIAETLDIHDVWFDQRLYAGQQWWKEILRRLEWCEGFIYLLSPDSVQSEYCQREFLIAQNLSRHIFPVLIHEQTQIPEELTDIQYADLSNGLTPEAVKNLLNAIHIREREAPQPPNPRSFRFRPLEKQRLEKKAAATKPKVDLSEVVGKAAEAMESGNFDQAVFLIKQAQSEGFQSRFVNLGVLLEEAEVALERQSYQRDAEREYRPIVELVKRASTRKLGCQALAAYLKHYPDYDPDKLVRICRQPNRRPEGSNGQRIQTGILRPRFTLPMLEWCEIPGGVLQPIPRSNGNGAHHRESVYVEHFHMSKYPVTNVQYDIFAGDQDGYENANWWAFSEAAMEWRMQNPEPKASRFKGEDRPRETVTWYEAVAFCNWLSYKTGLNITLPTDVQWQRAARGDEVLLYPWGNHFDTNLGNTRESQIRMTTIVMRYENAVSPYGVFDMAGNVWEWCLNAGTGEFDKQDAPETGDGVRAIFGGSFISVCERSQTDFHFNLSPEYHYATIGFRIASVMY